MSIKTCWFIHLIVCLTTVPKPLPKRALHIVRFRASSFKWQYPLLSLRSSSSFLCLLSRLPVTSIPPFIFPSITRCRRQFLLKMWPIQFAYRLRISCRIFLCSLTLKHKLHVIKEHGNTCLILLVNLSSVDFMKLNVFLATKAVTKLRFRAVPRCDAV
jgi:hypothetical protein